ncbi:uncharacterized protein LOC131427012 [Malaya genurostris]|uniref:uncharacterized protein LOC131427012 n=1 Tax=Malaya genurostris TaxID=325434 RepID=UPI0026F40868|nr:uncharacterized protein LOC131427012 [Malaya genurostris]
MVICTFFLNNNCRFGSKCNNDHIDLSSVIKTEVDVTIRGNQWPLSCFGPFKGRNCVPNFIEDYCFEEIRMMFLEAKMQNNIASHQVQLSQMINEAKQKMQWLSTTNRDIMNILIEIYNEQEDSSKPLNPNQPAGNPFGTQIGSSSVNIFGGANSGGFGTASSAFGVSTNTAGNIFGTGPSQTTTNIFGAATNANASGGNLFAKPAQSPAPTSNVFGITALGQQQQSNNVFGAPPVFGGTNPSLFAPANPSQTPSGGSLFGSSVVAQSSGNLFAQQPQSTFGQSVPVQNPFANPSQSQPASGTPFIAAPVAATGNPFANSSFGTTVQPTGSMQQNVFSSTFSSPLQQSTNPFAQSVQQQQVSQSLFLPAPQVTQTISPMTNQPAAQFGATAQSAFGGNSQQAIPPIVASQQSANLYSRLEDLSKEQLEAFNADRFELGKIPTVPPPRELCG